MSLYPVQHLLVVGILSATVLPPAGLAAPPDRRTPAPAPSPAGLAAAAIPSDEACIADADCVFLPSVCPRCPPTRPTWRPVGNRQEAERIRKVQVAVDCALPPCDSRHKTSNWRGKKPICVKRRCSVAGKHAPRRGKAARPTGPPAPPRAPWSKELRCKRHRDCVFAFSPCGRCPACAPTWRAVSNRKTYNRQSAYYAKARAACSFCGSCPDGKSQWLGTRARCIKGQCAPR